MRTRIQVLIVLLALVALVAPVSWAQPVPPTPRPSVAVAAMPAVAAAPVAPSVAVAPVAAATPVVGVAPVAAFDLTDQAPPPPPSPPEPPAPAQVQKVQAPKVVKLEPAPAIAEAPSSNMNVRIDVTITDQTGSGAPTKKTVSLTVADGGRGSVRSGVTVPIPSTTFAPQPVKEGEAKPMTSWSYRDMGLSLDVTGALIRGNYVRLRLAVEYNPVDEKMAATEAPSAAWLGQGPASFARFSQTLDLALENGKPLVVASSSDPVPSRNRTASLEVKATILK